jgi:hypothetical protein
MTSSTVEPYSWLISSLSDLHEGELATFQKARINWSSGSVACHRRLKQEAEEEFPSALEPPQKRSLLW